MSIDPKKDPKSVPYSEASPSPKAPPRPQRPLVYINRNLLNYPLTSTHTGVAVLPRPLTRYEVDFAFHLLQAAVVQHKHDFHIEARRVGKRKIDRVSRGPLLSKDERADMDKDAKTLAWEEAQGPDYPKWLAAEARTNPAESKKYFRTRHKRAGREAYKSKLRELNSEWKEKPQPVTLWFPSLHALLKATGRSNSGQNRKAVLDNLNHLKTTSITWRNLWHEVWIYGGEPEKTPKLRLRLIDDVQVAKDGITITMNGRLVATCLRYTSRVPLPTVRTSEAAQALDGLLTAWRLQMVHVEGLAWRKVALAAKIGLEIGNREHSLDWAFKQTVRQINRHRAKVSPKDLIRYKLNDTSITFWFLKRRRLK